jgi:hypothetical protein
MPASGMPAGHTASARTPVPRSSARSATVKLISADFVAQYTAEPGSATKPALGAAHRCRVRASRHVRARERARALRTRRRR